MPGFFKNETVRRLCRGPGLIAAGLLEVIYPSTCEACGTPVDPHIPLCGTCTDGIAPADPAEVETIRSRLDDPVLDSMHALWHFARGSYVRELQHQLKYGNRPSIGDWFGRRLAAAWRTRGLASPDVIAPIPLHERRIVERGYNQSAQIARGFAAVTSCRLDEHLLVRSRATRSQTSLSRTARQQNVQDAFQLSGSVDGLSVLIVDDVLTTGATLNEAAREIRRGRARTISAAAIGIANT